MITEGDRKEIMIIKKYKNKKLYNSSLSAYVSLDDILGYIKEKKSFHVFCNETNKDITNQIIIDLVSNLKLELGSNVMTSIVNNIRATN